MTKVWQRFRSWLLWRFAVYKEQLEGLDVRASVPFSDLEEEDYVGPVREALQLIRTHEPATLEIASGLLRGIFICQSETGGAVAHYEHRRRLVIMNPVYLAREWRDPVLAAMVLVHEIMHARARELGIEENRRRVEWLCYQRSIIFGKRCNAPKHLLEWARKEQAKAATIEAKPILAKQWIEEAQNTDLPKLYRWFWNRRIRQVEQELAEPEAVDSHRL